MKRIILILLILTTPAFAQRQVDKLNRGVVAIKQSDTKAFVSWRLLEDDRFDVAFNVYRKTGTGEAVLMNDEPITEGTCFVDEEFSNAQDVAYTIRAVENDVERLPSEAYVIRANAPARPYLEIPLKTPANYTPNDASAADLDGDGQYDIVIHMTGRTRDNSQSGETDPAILQAYKFDGTMLWEINLGPNIRDGAHYTQFLVYDFDGDGRAEMICKTSDGTKDGKGVVIGDANARHANEAGHILKGPEFLTVFDGLTGAAIDTVDYVPARTPNNPRDPDLEEYRAQWGDNYGNRGERYLACVAYLDGVRPSAVMCRGYYTRTTLCAWDFKDGKLTQRWLFDTGPDRTNPYFGQGNHQVSVADVDEDGKDEIIYGASVIDDTGTGLWSSGYGHGDALHVGDFHLDNPGLEIFAIQERFGDAGAHMEDAKTGKTLWKWPSIRAATEGGDRGEGPGRAMIADIEPNYDGEESWVTGAGIEGLWNSKGEKIGDIKPDSCNFGIWWDGDRLRELLDKNRISEWNWYTEKCETVLIAEDCESNNGTKATPCLSGDILGDWREEVIWRTRDNQFLRIYTTTETSQYRYVTLMQDPQYRLAIAWQNVAYNQPPHPSFYLGEEE